MAKKKLFKSKTNFSLRRLHQSGNYGNIYERDYTTIVNSLSKPGSQIPILNTPSFKLTVGANVNKKKKYFYGNWYNNPNSLGYSWTLENMPAVEKRYNGINLKPNGKKITDFACYGSASELIRVSLTNIVSNFPAEIYVTNTLLKDTDVFDLKNDNGSVSTASTMYNYYEYAIVDNPLFIDLIQTSLPTDSIVTPMRYMCHSSNQYDVISKDNTIVSIGEKFKEWNDANNDKKNMWEVSFKSMQSDNQDGCITNGELLAIVTFNKLNDNGTTENVIQIFCFYMDGELLYLADKSKVGYRIRPNESYINDFFNKLGDFEKILLNRETNYTATFEVYEEDETNGWQLHEKKYTWPTSSGDWNISINGALYSKYINKLTRLAITYDELFTNSIQRDMTHEAISNMDLTKSVITDNDEDSINSTKMVQILNVIGRQFDEIKRYADNIKYTNSVTYSQEQNAPDYFLTDSLNLSGWEVKEIFNDVSNEIVTNPMYSVRNTGFSVADANNEFMRRLKLNSKEIISRKGTKQGIEDLMAIFGFHSTDWLKRYYGELSPKRLRKAFVLSEHTYVANGYASNKSAEDVITNVKRINQLKDSFDIENINSPNSCIDEFQGIPVAEVDTVIPGDATDSNTLKLEKVPTQNNTKYKYIKVDNDYYEWTGYRILNNTPSDYSSNTLVSGTEIPKIKVNSAAKYILMRLYYYQWSGYYRRLDEKPFDVINVSNYKTVTNQDDLLIKDNTVQYLIYNSVYYEWQYDSDGNGAYVALNKVPDDLKTKNTKFYNAIPNAQDEDVKYIIFRGDYYEWVGRYVSTVSKPNDSTSSNTAYVNSLPSEKHSKKYVALNTYLIWDGKYNKYNNRVLVPWFDKNLQYDGNLYFQMKGAWGRNDGKTDNTGDTENSVYAYSVSKIHYVPTIEELYSLSYRSIDVNNIYYVGNDDIYLKVKDINKHSMSDGWETPTNEEIESSIKIVDNNKGNNPHTGEYDNGYSYLEAYGELFKNATFSNVKSNEITNHLTYGFNIARYSESTKCMYFGQTEMSDNIKPLRNVSSRQKIIPHNFFGGGKHEEVASLSIINSKEFHITFDDAHRDFIENDVIPYISQIIPSTTIFSYSFEHLTGDEVIFSARTHDVICDGGVCPIYGVS